MAILTMFFMLFSGASCLDDLFGHLQKYESDYMFSYYCYRSNDQELKGLWDKYGATIQKCPLAVEKFYNLSGSSDYERLEQVGAYCDSIVNNPVYTKEQMLERQKEVADSIREFNAMYKIDKKIKLEFKKNPQKFKNAIASCIKRFANDPSSIKIATIEHYVLYDFDVIFRGKNSFGALVLNSKRITLDERYRCVDINDIESDEDDE